MDFLIASISSGRSCPQILRSENFPCKNLSERCRILIAIGLGIENGETDATCDLGMRRIETLDPCNRRPKIDNVLNGVLDFCALAGGACMMSEDPCTRRSAAHRWHRNMPAEFYICLAFRFSGRHRVGKIFVRTHHGDARKVEGLPRHIG